MPPTVKSIHTVSLCFVLAIFCALPLLPGEQLGIQPAQFHQFVPFNGFGDVEKKTESKAALFDAKIFGEPLLLLENQVLTKQNKRADLVALDQYGNGVFIELKKREAKQGIETQALQYLANFANLKGDRFLNRFKTSQAEIDSFLGDYEVNSLNAKSRIMLVARSFDESVLSMGEWLASQGVAFRCLEYIPFEVAGRTFISFSVRFDRSRDPLYQFAGAEPRPAEYFWHNIGNSPLGDTRNDEKAQDEWWAYYLAQGIVAAGFNNERGDAGDKILNSYMPKDTIVAYASNYGALGWGVLMAPSYDLVSPTHDRFSAKGHRHRLTGIKWKNVAHSSKDAIPAKELKEVFGLNHPIQTKSKIRRAQAEALIADMKRRFSAAV